MTRFAIVSLGVMLGLTVAGWSDTIYFKDGSSLDGTVRRESSTRVVLDVPGGHLSFPAEDVDRIETNDKSGVVNGTPEQAPPAEPTPPALPALTEADEHALRAMINDLLTTDPAARNGARDRIARFGSEHDVIPFLERALPYITDRQAVELLDVVAKLDPLRAKPILINATISPLDKNRAKALDLLGDALGDAGTDDLELIRLFAQGTLDQSLEVRLAAIEALQDTKDRRATPVLVHCLENSDRRVQSASRKALRALWPPDETFNKFETAAQWRALLEITSDDIRATLDPATLTPLVEPPLPGDEDYNLGLE